MRQARPEWRRRSRRKVARSDSRNSAFARRGQKRPLQETIFPTPDILWPRQEPPRRRNRSSALRRSWSLPFHDHNVRTAANRRVFVQHGAEKARDGRGDKGQQYKAHGGVAQVFKRG